MTNGLQQPELAKTVLYQITYFLFPAPASMYHSPWTLHLADSCATTVSGINDSIEIKLSSLLESVFPLTV